MPTVPHPPRIAVRGMPPAVILPPLIDIPEFAGEPIEEGPPVEVRPIEEVLWPPVDHLRTIALELPRMRELIADRPYLFAGVSAATSKHKERQRFVAIFHTYDDAMTHEVSIAADGNDLRVSDVESLPYQPAPTDEEVARAIALARRHEGIASLIEDAFESQALLVSSTEPGDEHHGTRRFSVVFGPADERLPRINVVVDLVAERVLSFHHLEGGSR